MSDLQAVCADEELDDPRLVYADALMQSGDEATHARGEFIVIQCKLAQTDCPTDVRKTLEARERALLTAHKATWLAKYKFTEDEAANVVFRRGFIDTMKMTLARFSSIADSLAMNPRIYLDCSKTSNSLRYLRLDSMLRVKRLNLRYNMIIGKMAKIIANSKYLQNLTHLHLQYNSILSEGAVAIAQSEHMQNLTHLDLRHNSVTNEGAKAIAQSEHMQNLTHLICSYNFLSNEGAKAIAQSEHMQNLSHLYLRNCSISDEGAIALALGKLRNLTHLDLQYNVISCEAISLIRKRWPFTLI